MSRIVRPSPVCPEHGMPRNRALCRGCNAAYMRTYLWHRRQEEPDRELWRRARKRAKRFGFRFDLAMEEVHIPPACPVLGLPLYLGDCRSANSPSLDRIIPELGYVSGNVRVICDRANRLKGAKSLSDLRSHEAAADGVLRREYRLIAEYVERETLLTGVRNKARSKAAASSDWKRIEQFLDQVFSRGQLVDLDV